LRVSCFDRERARVVVAAPTYRLISSFVSSFPLLVRSDLPRLLREAERAQLLESMRSEDTESPPHSGNYEGGNSNGLSIENGTYRSAEIPTEDIPLLRPPLQSEQQPVGVSCGHFDTESLWQTAKNILDRCFQPPVVGALAGIFCAVTPLRGVFVDLVSRNSDAPLQWFFDGLYAVGQTAVPTNMLILGCNLSSSQYTVAGGQNYKSSGLLTTRSMIGIVIGKMIVMPIIGILSGWILKTYFWHIPDDIDGSFYLVLMIVFLTPTANNVMIIVELSGSGAKEGIARVIALQYAVAPVILSLTMTIAIGVASGWSS
jgi:predicted permease